jgi:predicted transcriptional regulator
MNKHLREFFPTKETQEAKRIRAMGHSARIRILFNLWALGPSKFNELWRIIQESKTSCSFHIKVLLDSNLIFSYLTEDGQNEYALNFDFESKVVIHFDVFLDDEVLDSNTFLNNILSLSPQIKLKLKSEYDRIVSEKAFENAERLRLKYSKMSNNNSG